MKYFILILCVFLCACDSPEPTERKPDRFRVEWHKGVWTVKVRFDRGELKGLVDEKTLTLPAHGVTVTMVEYFQFDDWDWVIDHWTPGVPLPAYVLEGVLYPADATGVDMNARRFAILPANHDGTHVTSANAPNYVNADYFANHAVTGSIATHRRSKAIHYRLEQRSDGLLVTWDGVDHWFKAP